MSNLIQYIVQDDPKEELKKKQSQTLLSRELSSQEDTDKNYKFNSRHLLENDFSHLQSRPAPTARSYLSQALAKNAAKEGSKVSSALSPKPIGNDALSYKIAQNTKVNTANDANIPSIKKNTDEELIKRMTPVLYQMEEPKNHIYIDTTWNKTSGVGANVNDWNTFKNINWQINGRAATEEEKRAAFDVYQKDIDIGLKNKDAKGNVIKNNKKADAYKSYSQLILNDEEINKLLKQHLQDDIKYLQKECPDFASYPPELQNVLLDIKFNTGNVSQENWPKLRKAIDEKNLFGDEGIIDNVHRKDVDLKRNNWAEQQIRNIKSW